MGSGERAGESGKYGVWGFRFWFWVLVMGYGQLLDVVGL